MVRYLALFSTPEDCEAFDQHYNEVHIPLVKTLPGLRRFAVGRNPAPVRGEPYYLISALEFDDMTTLKEAFASTQGEAAANDVPNLAGPDHMRSMIFELEDVDL
jgi:uncharacterized protein (TIGR02118 family)